MPQKLTQEQFIQRSKEKHNNKYDYSLVKYVKNHEDVCIICPIHGKFNQEARAHLKGNGCFECSKTKRTKNSDNFINEAKSIHGDKYDYSISTYINCASPVNIICPVHGIFNQYPNTHLKGSGCAKCSFEKQTLTQEEFIQRVTKVHGDKYDYSLAVYKNNTTPVIIICPLHGEFAQRAGTHMDGTNCPKCVCKQRLTLERFVDLSNQKHENKYDYSRTKLENHETVVEIICPRHGSFWQTATLHCHSGTGCPKCVNKVSKKETTWLNSIGIPNDHHHRQVSLTPNKRIKVDGYDPKTNTVYEFLGDFWHGNLNKYDPTDTNTVAKKTFQELYDETMHRFALLKQAGYTVVYIWESDFKEYLQYVSKQTKLTPLPIQNSNNPLVALDQKRLE